MPPGRRRRRIHHRSDRRAGSARYRYFDKQGARAKRNIIVGALGAAQAIGSWSFAAQAIGSWKANKSQQLNVYAY